MPQAASQLSEFVQTLTEYLGWTAAGGGVKWCTRRSIKPFLCSDNELLDNYLEKKQQRTIASVKAKAVDCVCWKKRVFVLVTMWIRQKRPTVAASTFKLKRLCHNKTTLGKRKLPVFVQPSVTHKPQSWETDCVFSRLSSAQGQSIPWSQLIRRRVRQGNRRLKFKNVILLTWWQVDKYRTCHIPQLTSSSPLSQSFSPSHFQKLGIHWVDPAPQLNSFTRHVLMSADRRRKKNSLVSSVLGFIVFYKKSVLD